MYYASLYKTLKSTISCLPIVVLIASCTGNKQSASDEMPRLYPAPLRIPLNTHEGYAINPLTGESIQSIKYSSGEPVKTGMPLQAIGKVIHPDIPEKSRSIPAGEPQVVPINLKIHNLQENLTVIPGISVAAPE